MTAHECLDFNKAIMVCNICRHAGNSGCPLAKVTEKFKEVNNMLQVFAKPSPALFRESKSGPNTFYYQIPLTPEGQKKIRKVILKDFLRQFHQLQKQIMQELKTKDKET